MSKSRKELEVENEMLKRVGYGANLTKIIIALIQYGALAFVFYCLSDTAKSLAGLNTVASFDVPFMNGVLGAIFGGGGIVYGHQQNKSRKNTVERLQKRIQDLEKQLDPNCSTSGLTSRGETHPEDM
ncbi:MAG: hypothetical protein HOP34_06275 [Methylococcaceae bacterium]|nr:hypothetical protein [Methylococcaceae bacterium]